MTFTPIIAINTLGYITASEPIAKGQVHKSCLRTNIIQSLKFNQFP